jgi:hypothetical protein
MLIVWGGWICKKMKEGAVILLAEKNEKGEKRIIKF